MHRHYVYTSRWSFCYASKRISFFRNRYCSCSHFSVKTIVNMKRHHSLRHHFIKLELSFIKTRECFSCEARPAEESRYLTIQSPVNNNHAAGLCLSAAPWPGAVFTVGVIRLICYNVHSKLFYTRSWHIVHTNKVHSILGYGEDPVSHNTSL